MAVQRGPDKRVDELQVDMDGCRGPGQRPLVRPRRAHYISVPQRVRRKSDYINARDTATLLGVETAAAFRSARG